GPVRRGVQMALTTPVKLAYYDDHAVYERLGVAWAFTSAAEPARWKSQITTGSEIEDDVDVECDVVVVGTGAGGAVVAKELADGGLTDLSPDRMAPYFDRVERELQVEIADERFLGGVARVVARGCDALGYSHRPLRRNAPGCDGSGICDYGCPTGAKRSTDVS